MKTKILLVLALITPIASTGQIIETFSDGEFQNNPTWIGNADRFSVNDSLQLQLADIQENTATLFTPAVISEASVVWEVFCHLDFEPSSSNRATIVLLADQPAFLNGYNGYFLRLGAPGNEDAIELRRQNGTSSILVASGKPGNIASKPKTKIKIIRDSLFNWSIWADSTGGNNFVLEGSGFDNTYQKGLFFGLICQYTLTNSQHFFFDDIRIQPVTPDTTPPDLVSFSALSAHKIILEFNELLNQEQAEMVSHYQFQPLVTIQNAVLNLSTRREVTLHLTEPLVNQEEYLLSISGLSDLSGNNLILDDFPFIYYQPNPVDPFDILITEFLADHSPAEDLPAFEFVEIYNRSDKVINLGVLRLADPVDTANLENTILLPDTYRILCRKEADAEYKPFGETMSLENMPTLNNGADILTLLDTSGQVVHRVAYSQNWYRDPIKKNGGWTLEMINPDKACIPDSSNWIASLDHRGGTPGTYNSVWTKTSFKLTGALPENDRSIQLSFNNKPTINALYPATFKINGGNPAIWAVEGVPENPTSLLLKLDTPGLKHQHPYILESTLPLEDCLGNLLDPTASSVTFTYYEQKSPEPLDLVISEIMAKPEPSSGLPVAPYIELLNRTDKALNIGGLYLKDNSNTLTLPPYRIPPGGYLILCDETDALQLKPFGPCIGIDGFPYLSQNGELLQLLDTALTVLFSLSYSSQWHDPPEKSGGGYALELINPSQICLPEPENWVSSTHIFGGTPGQKNEVHIDIPDTISPSILSVIPFSADSLWVTFSEPLDPSSLNPAFFSLIGEPIVFSGLYLPDLSYQHIILALPDPYLAADSSYTLQAALIVDCAQNPTASDGNTCTFTYLPIEPAAPFDILIHEIMADPTLPSGGTIGLPELEYLELFNRSGKNINLRTLVLGDQTRTLPLPLFIFKPGQHLILHGGATHAFAFYGNDIGIPGFFSLGNSEDYLQLSTRSGTIIHTVAYTDKWYQNSQKAAGGWSLEMINPEAPCIQQTNWKASQSIIGGSPGQPNSVLESAPDTSRPVLLRAFPVSATTVRLYFDKTIDYQQAKITSQYHMEGFTIISAAAEAPFFQSVVLQLGEPLQGDEQYQLTVTSPFADCIGNSVGLFNKVGIGLPQKINPGSIVFNEILFNPEAGGADFVELYNRSDSIFNTADLLIGNLDDTGFPDEFLSVTEDYLLFPGQYVVFSEDPVYLTNRYDCHQMNYSHCDFNPHRIMNQKLPTMPDKEGTLLLKANYPGDTRLIDRLQYAESQHNALLNDTEGVSLERVDPMESTENTNNWQSAAAPPGYGTPTYLNSQTRTVFPVHQPSPFFLTRRIFSPDSDGHEDLLHIEYRLPRPGYLCNIQVFDFHGQEVRRFPGNTLLDRDGFFIWDGATDVGTAAPPGIYIIRIELFNPEGHVQTFKETCVLAIRLQSR